VIGVEAAADSYRRRPDGPLVTGDRLGERVIVGFACVTSGIQPTSADDRVLLDGDETLESAPDRPLHEVESAVDVDRCGLLPPVKLPPQDLRDAWHLAPDLPARVKATIELAGTAWSGVAAPLIDAVMAEGHLVWLAGGVARDLVGGSQPGEVNDFDTAGTVPPGTFGDLADKVLTRLGLGTCRTTFSDRSGVFAIERDVGEKRLIEYKSLATQRFPFPTCGGDLAEDSGTRDFSVNCLFYDPQRHHLLDPTGHGMADLQAPRRRLRNVNTSGDPVEQVRVVLRALKFMGRWGTAGVDVAPFIAWLATLPPDLVDRIGPKAWREVDRAARTHLARLSPEDANRCAAILGPLAVAIMARLRRGE
jgi:hypothetical protein